MPLTTAKGGIANITAEILLSRRDPQAALDFFLNHYPNREEAATRIYAQWKNIRRILLKDVRSVSPTYEATLLSIREALEEEGNLEDAAKIDMLLEGNLGLRVTIADTKKKYLDDQEFDTYLKTIDPLTQTITDFRLPEELVSLANETEKSRASSAQRHERKARDTYTVTRAELDRIHAESKSYLDTIHKIETEADFWDIVFSVGVVSGRRIYEILSTLSYRQGPGDYQAYVTGIAKKQVEIALNLGEDVEYLIPLTIPYVLFEKAMDLIRGHRSYEGMDCTEVQREMTTREKTASNRCVGRVLTHTQKRNLYLEKAYRDREISGYLVGSNSCSKTRWYMSALCHHEAISSQTERYANMVIKD